MKFFDLYIRDEVSEDQIDQYTHAWHYEMSGRKYKIPLHDYLGMTWGEYKTWILNPNSLPILKEARCKQN